MTEYIVNPRRAARAPSRCATLVHTPESAWNAETEDISALGCQLVAPGAVGRGLKLNLVFSHPRIKGSLQVEGEVAWGSSQPPWRVGVAFTDASRPEAERWMARLVAAHPGLGGVRRVPDRLPLDAMLFLAPPPTFLVDFTDEEVEVLRHVAGGSTVATLRARLATRWSGALRAIFSLLARGVVTVSRSAAAHPSAWTKVMEDLGAEFTPEAAPLAAARPQPERAVPRRAPRPDDRIDLDLDPRFTPPPELAQVPAVSPATPAAPGTSPAPIDGAVARSAGTGWRGDLRSRTPEAQECFDMGQGELAAGRSHSAMAHLRRALQLAPGDAEIAAAIGRAMKGT